LAIAAVEILRREFYHDYRRDLLPARRLSRRLAKKSRQLILNQMP
jgi:hypothetical protein